MKKHEYQLVHIPRGLYTTRLLLILILAIVSPFLILSIIPIKLNIIVILLIIWGLAIILYKLTGKFVRNEMCIVIKNDVLTITETSSITRKEKEIKIDWNNIKSYIFYTTHYYHIIKLNIKNGKKVTLTLDLSNDQLARFEKDFHDMVFLCNQKDHSEIYLQPSIYETKFGLLIAMLLGLMMFVWPLVAWINQKEFQLGLALIFYSGASFFIYMVYRSHQKKNH